ncbi:cupin-like domain-containing protein [Streptomyces sp. SP18CS02]|uniref:cupin-like domain-containing protein n=1 Tax=Streptomyces sp. SP18CS02 TaxID=3002531 RepID=UPI002E7663B9|nr:cupin-like domain-containing protein [Streptomyces sp. SP18CS02]MEE1752885.1 cupin-like domain-containing protein [Streptomyces sp. SP18CS02]
MQTEQNLLKRRDVGALRTVEAAFRSGPFAELLDSAPELERRSGMTREEFEQEYRFKRRPVVLEGYAADWPSVRGWSFRYLAGRCADVPVVVDSYSSRAARKTTFGEFVTRLEESAGSGAAPLYLQEWYYQINAPEIAEDMPELDIAQYDFRRNLYGEAASTNHQLWIGQQGGITRLHQDAYSVDVMHAQILGEKLWFIMGPEAELVPGPDGEAGLDALCASPDTRLMRFVLRPGDVLYLPALWFHRIELLSDSIGLGRKCLDEVNVRAHVRQRIGELLALALNPDELRVTHSELFEVVIARARALADRMDIDLSRLRQ